MYKLSYSCEFKKIVEVADVLETPYLENCFFFVYQLDEEKPQKYTQVAALNKNYVVNTLTT